MRAEATDSFGRVSRCQWGDERIMVMRIGGEGGFEGANLGLRCGKMWGSLREDFEIFFEKFGIA